jgi:hypothetical protein
MVWIAGGWIHFCMKRLRTLKSFQIFKLKIKYKKPIAVQGLSNNTTRMQNSRSNLAVWYLFKNLKLNLKNQKPLAVDDFFKAYPMITL